jgi:uncharacterized protein (DUF983 family)
MQVSDERRPGVRMVCPHCGNDGLRLPLRALFSRRAQVVCEHCGRQVESRLGAAVGIKNFISGVVGMALMMVAFIFLWGRWFLWPLVLLGFIVVDAWIMATLHRRNLRRMAVAAGRAGGSDPGGGALSRPGGRNGGAVGDGHGGAGNGEGPPS